MTPRDFKALAILASAHASGRHSVTVTAASTTLGLAWNEVRTLLMRAAFQGWAQSFAGVPRSYSITSKGLRAFEREQKANG